MKGIKLNLCKVTGEGRRHVKLPWDNTYKLNKVSTHYVSKISLLKVSGTIYSNKGISVKEYNMLQMVLSDFSDRLNWGFHTNLHNIRKYGNNVSNNDIYSAIRPWFFS